MIKQVVAPAVLGWNPRSKQMGLITKPPPSPIDELNATAERQITLVLRLLLSSRNLTVSLLIVTRVKTKTI